MGLKRLSYRLISRACWHSGTTSLLADVAARRRFRLARRNGFLPRIQFQRRLADSFQILVYHRITRGDDRFLPGTPVDVLEKQVQALRGSYSIVDLRELVSRRSTGEPVPRNAVALTFDDGYRDNYELAFPVLRKWQVPATIFLATSFIDQLDVPWNDKIAFALRHTRRPSLDFEHGGRQHSYDLTGTAQKLQARDEILWLLRHIPHGDKQLLIGTITTALGVTDFGPLRESMLTWDHVREMHSSGIAFGAHTITHAYLTRLEPPEARYEICGSKQRIEAVLDSPVALFAYPAGTEADFNDDIKGEVRKAGFEAAVTTVFGFNDADTDLYALRRGGSAEHDQALFALQQAWYKLLN